ncbi:MAG: glycosyltransferase family 39 protein [Phycisphaerae bacterium]|nr:MAG: tetratricopeptide repeat protein [Planctomycetota bacterium]KAB2946367.1 MAG: tetratricopeptide repeat protein [Phycisphaerae bacterium]MBE7457260.1 glycosyltransferase family 39 protein [Planctomycetia bacterium]MCK6465476.1 tetratricopeptide repeat protein [Phycisphaerae bacterium]MCL4719131.1 glycosyltransferase family 39 protein [Phycisphaerae bacterium]
MRRALPEVSRRRSGRGRQVVPAVSIFTAALLVRLVHLTCIRDVPFFDVPVGDARAYVDWGLRIAEGDWIGSEPFYQAPLYPYLLGVIFRVTGPSLVAVRLVQVVMGGLSCVLLTGVAGRCFGRRAGWAAGLMLAFYPPAIFFDGLIQKTSLACFLTCALLSAWSKLVTRASCGGGAVAGALLGLLILTRENAWAWSPLLVVTPWGLGRKAEGGRQVRVGVAAGVIAGLAAVLTPVGARNWRVGGEWSFSTFQMGPNFYIGNGRDADGRYRPLVRGHETPEFERSDAVRLAESAEGRSLTSREVSRYWMARALAEMRESPLRAVQLLGLKALMALNVYEVGDVEAFSVYRRESPVLGVLGRVLNFGVVLGLASAGAAATWRRRKARNWLGAMFLAMLVAVSAFFILGRYRFPLVLVMMPWAGAGLLHITRNVMRRRTGRLRVAVFAGAAGACLAFVPPVHPEARLDALALSNLGVAYAERGDLSSALDCFSRAAEVFPESAETRFNLARALVLSGRAGEALEHFEAASVCAPDVIEIHLAWAEALEELGRSSEAHARYETAARLDPSEVRARAGLMRTSPSSKP